MTTPTLDQALEADSIAKALLDVITELELRPDKDPIRQLALEVDDILRRYVAEKAVPAGSPS